MGNKWGKYIVCIVLVLSIFVVYELRLAQWQLVDGEKYSDISDKTTNFNVKLSAARGEILDKNGEILAGNKTVYNVVMNAITMDSDRNPAIFKAIRIMDEDGVKWTDKLPIIINAADEYEFVTGKEEEIKTLKSADLLNMQDYATAKECMAALIKRYDCQGYSQKDARDIISVRYNMTKTQFSRSEPYVIAYDVPMETVQKISEKSAQIPGVETRVATERTYTDGTIAPHIIGTLGSISQEQYDAFNAEGKTYSSDNVSGYSYTEVMGQSGIEHEFEEVLRGTNGKEKIMVNSGGQVISSEITEKPVSGNSVYLTMDRDLQKVANDSLARNVAAANEKYDDCTAGAAVVIDVKNFGVLAASTYPTFDMQLYADDDKYYNNLLEDETKPLFNRALDGVFTPGSVFKPLVAMAALDEGVINSGSTPVSCNGVYDYFQDGNPATCLGVHGNVNVTGAIEQSCNTFFYDVGRMLTINKMDVYADLFSLGKKTGVEIGEANGIMSSPEEYEYNHGTGWVDGLTIQTAIGQCDSMFSPIQLATYCATIANNGVRYKTHFLDKVMDYDGQRVIKSHEPELAEKVDITPETLKIVQNAMLGVTGPNGTAFNTFGDYGVKIAAKTGTAEIPNHTDNTVFIAYAPFDDPQIAVAVVIEYGKSGMLSQAVAKDIFDQYFYGKTENYSGADGETADGTPSPDGAGAPVPADSTASGTVPEEPKPTATPEPGEVSKRGDDIPTA